MTDDDLRESRFTPATQLCPHPDRWHSADVDSTEHEVSELVAAFVRALQPDLVVETGSAWGVTAARIGLALMMNGQGVLHTIEPDPERAAATREICKQYPVVVDEMKSLDWTPPGPIGFAWFDSLHQLRVPEVRAYYPYFRPGSIVGFHDTADHHGIWPEIERLEEEGLLLPIRLPTPRGVTFGEVVVGG